MLDLSFWWISREEKCQSLKNTCFVERVTKQIFTNMLPNLFIAISAPYGVYVAECKQFSVCIAGDDFFQTSNLPRSPSIRITRKMYCLRLWVMCCFIHCNRSPLQCLRIALDDLFDCGANRITMMMGQVIVNRNVKDENSFKNRIGFNRLASFSNFKIFQNRP